MQLVANIRRFKGAAPQLSVIAQPIAIDGKFDDWRDVFRARSATPSAAMITAGKASRRLSGTPATTASLPTKTATTPRTSISTPAPRTS